MFAFAKCYFCLINLMKRTYFILLILFAVSSCTKENNTNHSYAFYHWKSKAVYTEPHKDALALTKTNSIYMHYFDIETIQKPTENNDGIYPTYVLKKVEKQYQNYTIIPVVYITNSVFKTKNLTILNLSNRIQKLIHQISLKHFNKKIRQIQIDCDWTSATRNAYFSLLKQLKKEFTIDVTIRLHQIKYKNKTGIPPVKKGTLMLYNVGDLKNRQQNSILENTIVKKYVNSQTAYPLTLNVGLPLFSQTIVTNTSNKIKIIKNTERNVLENDKHFKKIDPTNFTVAIDTLYKGFYLSKDFQLKLEEIKESEIINSYKTIKQSKLNINDVIFYHLDDSSLSNIDLKNIINNL